MAIARIDATRPDGRTMTTSQSADSASMRHRVDGRSRIVVLAVLVAGYATMLVGVRGPAGNRAFDPLEHLGRQVETAIETGRFADALPTARSLRAAHPDDPTVLYWLGEIYRGLDQAANEAAAWRDYARASSTPDDVCPSLPLALTKAGDAAGALGAYEACVTYAPDDPERLVDLAAEYARRGQWDLARTTYQRVRDVDPGDPRIARRIAALGQDGPK